MRTVPTDDDDRAELARLNAEPWMVECLSYNPDYVHWEPGEDYMSTNDKGWATSLVVPTWPEFGPWELDEMNECVHFYFEIVRESRDCDVCGGTGYNPETRKIADDFYDFAGTGRRWVDRITQDEADVLMQEGRCKPGTLAKDLNAEGGRGHDAINRWILIEARAKRLGVWGKCSTCEGCGYTWTAPAARLGLVVWFLHPRKGCSRGVRVESIEQGELPAVFAFLREARDRNAARFSKIPEVLS